MNFPLRIAFPASHGFWVVLFSFSFVSRDLFISFLILLLTHSLFSNMLFSLPVFVCFSGFFLLLICSFVSLLREDAWYDSDYMRLPLLGLGVCGKYRAAHQCHFLPSLGLGGRSAKVPKQPKICFCLPPPAGSLLGPGPERASGSTQIAWGRFSVTGQGWVVFTRLVEVQIWFQWVLGHSANVAGHTMPSCHLLGAHTPLWLGGVSWSSQGEASSFSGPKRPRFGPVKGGCTREIKSSVLELHYSVCPRFFLEPILCKVGCWESRRWC